MYGMDSSVPVAKGWRRLGSRNKNGRTCPAAKYLLFFDASLRIERHFPENVKLNRFKMFI